MVANSTAGTAKVVVDQLRAEGIKAGLLKPRVFRPFPGRDLAQAVGHLKAMAILDRSVSFGAPGNAGPLFLEVVASLALHGVRIPVAGYVYGLGGRDIVPREIEAVYRDMLCVAEKGQAANTITYLSVRE
jgi:pyruvate ferredoxin oxidoreductase alpha subunit